MVTKKDPTKFSYSILSNHAYVQLLTRRKLRLGYDYFAEKDREINGACQKSYVYERKHGHMENI